MGCSNIFPLEHFKAVFYRRFNKIRRSKSTLIGSGVATILFSGLAIFLYWLMVLYMVNKQNIMNFKRYSEENTKFFFVKRPEYTYDINVFKDVLVDLYRQDRNEDPIVDYFASTDETNEILFKHNQAPTKNPAYISGWDISSISNPFDVNFYHNSTTSLSSKSKNECYDMAIITRMLFRYTYGGKSDFSFLSCKLLKRFAYFVFGQIGPMLISDGLLTLIPLMISPVIADIRGEIRGYMVSCSLKLLPYWIATFLIDLIYWVIIATLTWAMFLIFQVKSFLDNIFSMWYILVFSGPSFLVFLYAFSFCFTSAESAARLAYLILFILTLIPCTIGLVRRYEDNPVWLDWIYSIFPPTLIQQGLQRVSTKIGNAKEPFSYYWSDEHGRPYLIMMWFDFVFYSIILMIIEIFRKQLQERAARKAYGGYNNFFKDAKESRTVTAEARDMDELVHREEDWAVRILDVSRLFINTAGKPIPAVNCVSLGIRKGSLFGFLGANGAGKTTLIKMITGMLPPSSGTIEVDGEIAICPQFNTHLDQELTPAEHFRVYSLLYHLDPETEATRTNDLIKSLELEELKDKPLRELSGGDVRKLAIALCFLGPANVILLDEPTAFLDSTARKGVQDLLLQLKGEKTFMLCTHILSEAEFLCDMLSIMVKGNVYTVGSPQYLSQRFGTGYKIDIMLKDESEECNAQCDEFFRQYLPTASLTIKRQKARIYSIPATDITMSKLFTTMQNGVEKGYGITYYTCSSSSLERVFMEIVRMSESDDVLEGNQVDILESQETLNANNNNNNDNNDNDNNHDNNDNNHDNDDNNTNIENNENSNDEASLP